MAQAEHEALLKAARGGRVASSGFLEPEAAARLAARLRAAEVGVSVWGGYPGARRRVVTAYPESVPEATAALGARYAEGLGDALELRVALGQHLGKDELGDIVQHPDGLSVIGLERALSALPRALRVGGREVALEPVPLSRVAAGSRKRLQVVVPSLRADALGAKAFGVSRSYFSKGIAAGNVTVNGERASKSSSVEVGDEVHAEGLGRFYLVSVQGETRRGNLKVVLEVERS